MKLSFRLTLLLSIIVFITSCEEEPPVICSQEQEEAVIIALSSTLDNCTCEISVIRATFLGNTVYALLGTAPNCSFAFDPTLYNCDGQIIPASLRLSQDTYNKLVKFDEVLYRCND